MAPFCFNWRHQELSSMLTGPSTVLQSLSTCIEQSVTRKLRVSGKCWAARAHTCQHRWTVLCMPAGICIIFAC